MSLTARQPLSTDIRLNLKALAAAQKSPRGTAAYSRMVNRPLARRVAAFAHAVGITPNQATAASATLSLAGLALLALVEPRWWVGVAVAALLAGGYVLDSVDGQIARLSGRATRSGEWLDHTVDCLKTASLHLAVLLSWYRFTVGHATGVSDAWLLAPLLFEVVAVTTYFGLMLMPTLRPAAPVPPTAPVAASARAAEASEHPLRRWLLLPTDYGAQCWLFVLLGAPALFRWAYLALLICCALALVAALRKWWIELRSLDAA
ncbi:CDP-alcohol phosphatidyltransferase family protein [Nocardioides sp.]|uniref:CDP-alcohol phosphatidyltransferase family protein n=1 Tax=Nocardioides sp. TaxID=35761 RepID=UPI00260F3D68|nr:CDP-alcohol phosphatidyltransferase family protein [Nocardioides sp.]